MPAKPIRGVKMTRGDAFVLAGRVLIAGALALYLAGLFLPFLHGSIKLLVVPVSRSLTLPQFAMHLADNERFVTLALVVIAAFVAPVALFLGILTAIWPARRPLPGVLAAALPFWRWRGWAVVILGAALTSGIRASSGVDGTPSLRLLPGAWTFVGSLVVGAAAATLIGSLRKKSS